MLLNLFKRNKTSEYQEVVTNLTFERLTTVMKKEADRIKPEGQAEELRKKLAISY